MDLNDKSSTQRWSYLLICTRFPVGTCSRFKCWFTRFTASRADTGNLAGAAIAIYRGYRQTLIAGCPGTHPWYMTS